MIRKILKHSLAIVVFVLPIHQVAFAAEETKTASVNGDFEKGLAQMKAVAETAAK